MTNVSFSFNSFKMLPLSDEIKDFLTVYGDKADININTADKKVIMALSDDLTEGEIGDIEEYREDEENNARVEECL